MKIFLNEEDNYMVKFRTGVGSIYAGDTSPEAVSRHERALVKKSSHKVSRKRNHKKTTTRLTNSADLILVNRSGTPFSTTQQISMNLNIDINFINEIVEEIVGHKVKQYYNRRNNSKINYYLSYKDLEMLLNEKGGFPEPLRIKLKQELKEKGRRKRRLAS